MKLTKDDDVFLSRAQYVISDICDVVGLKIREISVEVKKTGKRLGYGKPCTNGGHRLKWPSGHCAPCNPEYKSFRKRFTETKFIYIAGSLSGRLIKVGVGDDPDRRVSMLSYTAYATASDWELLFKMQVPESGRLEHDILSYLSNYSRQLGYIKDGQKQIAIEALNCSYFRVLSTVGRFATRRTSDPWQSQRASLYDFERAIAPPPPQ
ncbi:MAG: GIY-YIG nuclease family protein [Aestuariivirga sp.]